MGCGLTTTMAHTLLTVILVTLLSNLRSPEQFREELAHTACPSGSGIQFWRHEWEKHGTCAELFLEQHDYFEAALTLKHRSNLLQALTSAGVDADGGSYRLSTLKEAIKEATGYSPFIECSVDCSGNTQLYQVFLCVDTSASNFMECSVFPTNNKRASQINFPSF